MPREAKPVDPAAFKEVQDAERPEEYPPAEQPLDETETVDGGRRVMVAMRNGTTEKVKIHQFTLDDCLTFDDIRTRLGACVDFFCKKPKGWNEKVSPEASLKIYDIGVALNKSFFDSVMARVRPELDAVLESRGNLAQRLGVIIPGMVAPSPASPSSLEKAQNGSAQT
jgi:hypothetical protein